MIQQFGPATAIVRRGDLEVATLKAAGVPLPNEVIGGPGRRRVPCEDSSGNVVELFQAA